MLYCLKKLDHRIFWAPRVIIDKKLYLNFRLDTPVPQVAVSVHYHQLWTERYFVINIHLEIWIYEQFVLLNWIFKLGNDNEFDILQWLTRRLFQVKQIIQVNLFKILESWHSCVIMVVCLELVRGTNAVLAWYYSQHQVKSAWWLSISLLYVTATDIMMIIYTLYYQNRFTWL